MTKNLVLILIAFVFGFFSSRFYFKNETPQQYQNLKSAKDELISISQNEYIEYTQIKDLKLKYEKADELLGKVMLLFLADIGFKLKESAQIENPIADTEEILPPPKIQDTTEPEPAAVRPPQQKKIDTDTSSGLAGKSSVIKALQTEKQIREALDKAIIDNPKIESAKGQILSPKKGKIFEGRYSGDIKFLDGKRENLNVTWDLFPDQNKSEFSGTFTLAIHGPSKNSDTKGYGSIDNIVSLSEDENGYLVNGCGDSCYLQLYYNSAWDQFIGNYYEESKGAQKKFQRLGIVDLKK
jgi:hypothetical protein